jgi:hypothetical protein
MHEDLLLRKCINRGILDKDYEKTLDKLSEEIKKLKIQLFINQIKTESVKNFKFQLKQKNAQSSKLSSHLFNIKRNSIEGLARFCKNNFIFINSIYIGENPANITDIQTINQLTYKYAVSMPTEAQVRKAVRSGEWRSIWVAEKNKIFLNHISELTEDQRAAMHFSQLYDFAYEHDKCPNDAVFEDDDIFDGWYLYQVEKNKAERKKSKIANKDEDDALVKEYFYVAQDQKEASQYYEMNDPESRKIIQDRNKLIAEKGKVNDLDFKDIQQDLSTILEEKTTQHIRGKK